jgi:cysteine desulfurase
MGCDEVRARGAVRFSLGRFTTAEEIDYAAQRVSAAVNRLRELSPLWQSGCRVFPGVDWAALP